MRFVKKDGELNFESEVEYKEWLNDLPIEIPEDTYNEAARYNEITTFAIWIYDAPRATAEMCGNVKKMSFSGYYPMHVIDYKDNEDRYFLVKKADVHGI